MIRGTFSVQKALNNNVVIAESNNKNEVIFIGKGIGFGKKNGDFFEAKAYDKVYSLVDEQEKEKYIRLVTKETEETMLIIHEAIEIIHEAIGFKLEDRIHFALTQHLALALQRTRDQTGIQNPFLTETKWLYYETYEIADRAVDFIFNKTGLRLPDAEVGFITLHIQSAIRDSHSSLNKESDLLTRCISYIEEKSGVTFERDDPSFRRLVHFLKLIYQDEVHEKDSDLNKQLILFLKENHPVCYNMTWNLVRMIVKATGVSVAHSEVIHLLIYIRSTIEAHNKT
ncbi:PRD domain-containing protein [Salipaludibacillus sp. HK11]|uniref:PRD domain-containing protein n=1 Tax=Salipaludibacillus sp. HK11 TaxID=3394320 RepID=UPI0039FD5C7C